MLDKFVESGMAMIRIQCNPVLEGSVSTGTFTVYAGFCVVAWRAYLSDGLGFLGRMRAQPFARLFVACIDIIALLL